jgi:hypothetical protein
VVIENKHELHNPHTMLEVVKLKLLHPETSVPTMTLDEVASLLHDQHYESYQPKVQPPSTLNLWLHPPN